MTITLSDQTWKGLSDEYLYGWSTIGWAEIDQAQHNAHELAEYLYTQVEYLPEILDGDRLLYAGIAWVPVLDSEPYAGLPELSEAFHQYVNQLRPGHPPSGPIKVSDLYHDHPVFLRVDNLRFRVWHDTGHVFANLGFDRGGELELFVRQAQILKVETNGRALVDALFSESVYQLAASVVLGTFPDVQHVRTPGPVGRALLDAWGL
jgi:hypothetical protein